MPTATNRGDTPDKSETLPCRECGTPSACNFHGECLSRPPADQVPDMVERVKSLLDEVETWDEAMLAEFRETPPAKRLAAMLAALQAVPAASEVGWQPIESAPKDGKLVVFWQREFGLHVARWNDGFEEWHGTDWEHTPPIDPTHWMRPEPPALKASGEE